MPFHPVLEFSPPLSACFYYSVYLCLVCNAWWFLLHLIDSDNVCGYFEIRQSTNDILGTSNACKKGRNPKKEERWGIRKWFFFFAHILNKINWHCTKFPAWKHLKKIKEYGTKFLAINFNLLNLKNGFSIFSSNRQKLLGIKDCNS